MTQINPVADALVGEWLSLPEVAARLGLPISRVKQLLRDRKLLAVTRPGGDRAIPAAFLDGEQIVKGLPGTLTVLFDCGFDDERSPPLAVHRGRDASRHPDRGALRAPRHRGQPPRPGAGLLDAAEPRRQRGGARRPRYRRAARRRQPSPARR